MEHFDPIAASAQIKESFIDYITTSFRMADPNYTALLRAALMQEGNAARGPYLDISGSYLTGASLSELMASGEASKLFAELEKPVPEEKRKLPLNRKLFTHQVRALQKANARRNLVVTTGTGSGKTECFLIPVLNALLQEQEQCGKLSDGVRAIIIYPMNALANDQMKRMRGLLANYPAITFGLYNGNTAYTYKEGKSEYYKAYGTNATLLDNELISREQMQKTPPHILITNYSMLEYMMLRPKDDNVFSGTHLRFIILDEAHIYKGTTGMETAMLMRRLRARIQTRNSVQFILTSATLGGKDADQEITQFARTLCDVDFDPSDIIRSESALPPMLAMEQYPPALFTALAQKQKPVSDILRDFGVPDFAPEGDDAAKLYALMLHAAQFHDLLVNCAQPASIDALTRNMQGLSPDTVRDLIAAASAAEQNGISLIKARYHFFVRALEGAYITLNAPQQLFLQRQTKCTRADGSTQAVFEIAICEDCGRIALVGMIDRDGFLQQVSRKNEHDPNACEYFLVVDAQFQSIDGDTDIEANAAEDDETLTVCACCGKVGTKADLHFGAICGCKQPEYIYLKRVRRTQSGTAKCPACGYGSMRAFYLGNDSATAVLGTELFEQLPDCEVTVRTEVPQNEDDFGLFQPEEPVSATETKPKMRQFLCFSDSRSEAAYFADYMERTYQGFLRRRAILQVAEALRQSGQTEISVPAFVSRLIRFFDEKKTFRIWKENGRIDGDMLHVESERHAWIAVLNEMFNARKGTSLMSLGRLAFSYQRNDRYAAPLAKKYGITEQESRDLLDQLAMDAVLTGAITPGGQFTLSDAEMEYIFYSEYQKKLVLQKTADMHSALTGWAGRKRPESKAAHASKYYPNARMQRLMNTLGMTEEEADKFLVQYWNGVFRPAGTEFTLSAEDFRIRFLGDEKLHFYRCKTCGFVTPYNVGGHCASVRCSGTLEPIDPADYFKGHHYLRLYQTPQMESLQIKEHTAQISKSHQTRYQQAFVDKEINALSCSTTFEMGVDVGSLETVYMRNIPPSPANYVQRAGRAGRSKQSAAYVLTYAKLSSHDMTFYSAPEKIISGSIDAPVFSLRNEKVVNRHIFAVALSKFFALHEEVYGGDDQSPLLNEGGYEVLKDYLASKPEDLKQLLLRSVPEELHDALGIPDFGWTEKLIGKDGVLEIAVRDFRDEIKSFEKHLKECDRLKDRAGAAKVERDLRAFRCAKEDGKKKKRLIDFLVRNNVLPKYGFPVDTVELCPADSFRQDDRETLQLARDLQLAIAEYAPGAEVIADGKMYTSRYIRRLPYKDNSDAWERGCYCECPSCHEFNFSKKYDTHNHGTNCISCGTMIPARNWKPTIEPRRGFWTDGTAKEVPLRKPERDYKTADYYIGDTSQQRLIRTVFSVNGMKVELESTANDSLAVVGLTDYYVCETCGYASDTDFSADHKTARGYKCTDKNGTHKKYRLSHTFKTFVAKIKFCTPAAQDEQTMLSVLYAMLEGLSRELSIERTDLKGCLHRELLDGCQRPIFSLILYDAVAGGAGHVRRLITEDADVFRRVLQRAISVADGCTCDPSCYQCLRNYYNAQIHDLLDRKKAAEFLKEWVGDYVPVPLDDLNTREPALLQEKNGGRNLKGYTPAQIWHDVLDDAAPDERAVLEALRDAHTGSGGDPVLRMYFVMRELSTEQHLAELVWKKQHVMLFLLDQEEDYRFAKESGWHCFFTGDLPDPQALIRLIGG